MNLDPSTTLDTVCRIAYVRGRDGCCQPPTGSPEAVARLRFPQNVACGFTAPRSSAVGSQHRKGLQLPVREAQFWLQQRCPFFDLVEIVPRLASAGPAAAAQHPAPVTLASSAWQALQACT